MPQQSNQPARATGTITIEKLDRVSPGDTPRQSPFVPTHRYTWHPGPATAGELPRDFEFSFNCNVDPDGVRHFRPTAGVNLFLLQASLSGSVLLGRYAKMTREQKHSYHAMRLIFQLGAHLQERFDRGFKWERDLYISAPGRVGGVHVLPEHLGLVDDCIGNPWTPRELIDQGRASANQAGLSTPDEETCIRLGLLEAARQNPLRIEDPDDCRKVVRMGLFDLGPDSEHLTEAAIERVQGRLLVALHDHLEDDSATFNRWFFENFDSVVKRIAKKKKPDGPIARETVWQAILESVFRSYSYLGQCVNLQMRDFLQCLPEPLTADEHAVFDPLYLRQPMLGDLPLILLYERLSFLHEVVLDILERPNDKELWGVVLRMLQIYGEMASKKREGDRNYKRQRHHRNDENRSAVVLLLDENRDQAASSDSDLFQKIAAKLREMRHVTCSCGTSAQWCAQLVDGSTGDEPRIRIRYICELCGHNNEQSISRDEFAAIGKKLMGKGENDQ